MGLSKRERENECLKKLKMSRRSEIEIVCLCVKA